MDLPGRTLVALPRSPKTATRIRGSVVFSSQQALRTRGHYARYRAALDPEFLPVLDIPEAQTWLPMEVGVAHYTACEALGLSYDERYAIGREVEEKVQRGVVNVIAKIAQRVGASPWILLEQAPRLWSRIFVGSAVGVSELGPAEAYFQVAGWPLAPNTYLHAGVAGVVSGFVTPLCGSSSAQLARFDALSAAWRVTWT